MAVRQGLQVAACVTLFGSALLACSDDDAASGASTVPAASGDPSASVETAPVESSEPQAPPSTAPSAATDECPFIAAEEISAIMDEDLVLPPGTVAVDPVGRRGASCGFVNATSDYVVNVILYEEKVLGAVSDEISSHRENDVSFVEIDDLGTQAIATGGAGALNLAAESDTWYLILSVVSPPEEGADPFTPDADLLDKSVTLARAVVQ
jgi:hypothetical protein